MYRSKCTDFVSRTLVIQAAFRAVSLHQQQWTTHFWHIPNECYVLKLTFKISNLLQSQVSGWDCGTKISAYTAPKCKRVITMTFLHTIWTGRRLLGSATSADGRLSDSTTIPSVADGSLSVCMMTFLGAILTINTYSYDIVEYVTSYISP